MTFRNYAWKIRLGNTENFLDIDDLTDGYLLWRNGSKVMSTLIDQGKLSLSAPQNPNDAATKQYVDDNLNTDESARVAVDTHLQAQIDALMGTSLTSGDKGDITIAVDGYAWTVDTGAVTNAKLAAVASGIIKGRSSAGTGAVEDLTGTQATALLNVFNTETKGLTPAATGGGSTNFLRADGAWAAPPAGTVTGVSVVSANGLAGTVANSGTTPAITLSTSVTGVLKGNGTAISAAVSGTDYAPATSGSAVLKGNGAGGFASAASGTDYAPATSGTAILKGSGTGGFSNAAAGTDYAPATSGTSILSGNGSGGFSGVTVGTGLSFTAGTLSSSLVGVTDGDKGDITVASTGTSWTIDSAAVTNAKLANVATATFKGRTTAGTGAPEDLTSAQATALLGAFNSTLKGLAPASGGGTANYLRADGSWATPPGTATGTVTSVSVVSVNGLAGTVANSGTTPAITLSTSITGVLKGNGAAISAATAGTDYAAPTSGTSILSGNGAGGFSPVTIGSGLTFSAGLLSNSQVGLTDGDKGDITVSSTGATWTIDNAVVTNAKLNNVNTATIKGRATAGAGSPEDLTGTQATALLDNFSSTLKGLAPASGGGTTNFLRADGTWSAPPAGTVTTVSVVSANGLAGTVANPTTAPAITLSTSVTGLLKGNGTAISAAVSGTDYAPATNGTSILYGDGAGGFSNAVVGTSLTFAGGTLSRSALTGDVTAAANDNSTTIANNVVSNVKLADVPTATFKGRITAATGDPEDLTGTQATSLLNVFNTSLKGLAPASGGGTANYLRADGTWAAPPGSGNYATLDTAQTITAEKVISVSTASTAFRITQAGAGESFRVEDSANPDSTPFVITASGDVGIGTAAPATNLHLAGTQSRLTMKGLTSVPVTPASGDGVYWVRRNAVLSRDYPTFTNSDDVEFNLLNTGGSSVMVMPFFSTANLTSARGPVSQTSYAIYLGRSPQYKPSGTSAEVKFRVTGVFAGVTWAEVAVATGADGALTTRGFASVSSNVTSTGPKTITVNITSDIKPGDDVWVIFAINATTLGTLRAASVADNLQTGVLRTRTSTRPSTMFGGSVFTTESATALPFWMALVI